MHLYQIDDKISDEMEEYEMLSHLLLHLGFVRRRKYSVVKVDRHNLCN